MIKWIVCFGFVFEIILVSAQPHFFIKKWDYRYGGTDYEYLYSFIQTKDGGFMTGGSSYSSISGDKTQSNWDSTLNSGDCWVVKLDSLGIKQWDKRYGGINYDFISALKQTFDSGYILCCISYSRISGDKTEENWDTVGFITSDVWIVKIDSVGNKLWEKRLGTTIHDQNSCIENTNDGGFIVGCRTRAGIDGDKTQDNRDGTNSTDDYWIIKIDSLGNKEWDKRFGGTGQDGLTSVLQANDGGYVLAGYSGSGANGDKTEPTWGFGDYWVVRIDSSGNKIWDKDYGSDGDDSFDEMIKTRDGGYLLGGDGGGGSGSFTDALCGQDYHIVKIDSMGTQLWDKAHGGGPGVMGNLGNDYLQSLFETSDGGFLIGGYSSASGTCEKTENNTESILPWIVKTDSIGNKEWDKTIFLNQSSGITDITQTSDGCYVIALTTQAGIGGYKTQPNWDVSDSTADYWIMKFCMDTVSGILSPALSEGEGVIQVYPNPFSVDLSLTLPEGEGIAAHEAVFTITDVLGNIIYRREENNLAANYTKVLDLSWLASGVYFVEVSSPPTSRNKFGTGSLPKERGEVWKVVKRVVKE